MAASYPSSLPIADPAGANLASNPHSALHDDMYDEIVAIATELGTTPKGTFASVKARFDADTRGTVAYAQITSSLASFSTLTLLSGLSVTFTAVAGRRYKMTAHFEASSSNIDSVFIINIENTTVNLKRVVVAPLTTSSRQYTGMYVNNSSISGSTTWRLNGTRDSGTGNCTITASATNPTFVLVEDIGPL